MIVSTARLDLVPLPLPLLEALVAGAAALASYPIAVGTFAGDDHVLRLRRDQLRADPAELPWLFRAAVLCSSGQVIGRGGFHAPPDAEGTVEIGYSVQPAHRRQGYATLATISGLGFVHTGEQMDEIDGLELVHTLELG